MPLNPHDPPVGQPLQTQTTLILNWRSGVMAASSINITYSGYIRGYDIEGYTEALEAQMFPL